MTLSQTPESDEEGVYFLPILGFSFKHGEDGKAGFAGTRLKMTLHWHRTDELT